MLTRNDVIRIMDTWRSQDDRTFSGPDSKRKDCINQGPNQNRPNKDFKIPLFPLVPLVVNSHIKGLTFLLYN